MKALKWNELVPGDYWAFYLADPAQVANSKPEFVSVIGDPDDMVVEKNGDTMELNAHAWEDFQFVPCCHPLGSEVQFQ
jgi:hypothetical protein